MLAPKTDYRPATVRPEREPEAHCINICGVFSGKIVTKLLDHMG